MSVRKPWIYKESRKQKDRIKSQTEFIQADYKEPVDKRTGVISPEYETD